MPNLLGNKSWPDSLMKEFSSQLHKFMATLTDAHFQVGARHHLH